MKGLEPPSLKDPEQESPSMIGWGAREKKGIHRKQGGVKIIRMEGLRPILHKLRGKREMKKMKEEKKIRIKTLD